MSVAQQSFASAIEHRLRARRPQATVEATGNGWFAVRTAWDLPPRRMRRAKLVDYTRAVEAAQQEDSK